MAARQKTKRFWTYVYWDFSSNFDVGNHALKSWNGFSKHSVRVCLFESTCLFLFMKVCGSLIAYPLVAALSAHMPRGTLHPGGPSRVSSVAVGDQLVCSQEAVGHQPSVHPDQVSPSGEIIPSMVRVGV